MGLGTAAYGVLAGLSAGIGLFFLALGLRRGLELSAELFVGLLALAAAGQTVATLALHSSADVEKYAAVLHGPFSYFGIAALVATTWTVGVRTELWYPQLPLALTGLGLIAAALNALVPGALIVDEVTGLREVGLFGEVFVVHRPGPSSLGPILLGYLVVITGYVGLALLTRSRRGGRNVDLLMVGVAVAWTINLYDVLVDGAVVDTSYLAPFGLVALVAFLAIENANVIVTSERRLATQSTMLEDVVTARTAALQAAHEDLVKQLDAQNSSALRLARLSEIFLFLNRVSVTDDVEKVLTEALGHLGETVDATDVHLTWQQSTSVDDGVVTGVDWNRPGMDAATTDEPTVIDRSLRSGEVVVGRLVFTSGDHGFSAEHRRLVDLTVQYLTGLLLRLQLESSRLNSAVDDERHRIARELHDSLSQRLYAAAFNAETLSLSAGPDPDPDAVADGAAKIRVLVLSTLAEMRTLLFELQPEVLHNQSLTDLVAQLCTSVTEIYQQPVDLVVVDDEGGVPTTPKLALYRIVQEAVGNALRHSQGSQIGVIVDVSVDQVSIEVVDDGTGFDPDQVLSGHGLRNMRQRATEMGAGLDLVSGPEGGTTVRAIWPRHRDPLIDLTSEPGLEVAG